LFSVSTCDITSDKVGEEHYIVTTNTVAVLCMYTFHIASSTCYTHTSSSSIVKLALYESVNFAMCLSLDIQRYSIDELVDGFSKSFQTCSSF